jgi:hypothetical protein
MGVGPMGHPEGCGHRRPRQRHACPGRRFCARASRGGTDAHAYADATTHTRACQRARPFDADADCAHLPPRIPERVHVSVWGCVRACVRACVAVAVSASVCLFAYVRARVYVGVSVCK